MRILHVNKYLYRRGGAEGYMQDLAALQVAAGHQVEFFGMTHPDNPDLRFADLFPPLVTLEPPPDSRLERARATARMFWSESTRRGMAAVLDEYRPDVVHLHNVYHQLSPSVLRPAAARGVPMVMTLHDYKLACPSYQFMADGQPCTRCLDGKFRHAVQVRCKDGSLAASAVLAAESRFHRTLGNWEPVDAFVSPSRFLAARMADAGLFPGRIEVVSNFVDPATVPVKSAAGGGVVFAGRLSREKGVDTLVEAVGLLRSARLDIAGDGPERDAVERLADQVAPGRVTFHGRLGRDELLALLRESSVATVPSRWHENMPMAVLEAFASGLPVVTTDLGGLPELVTPALDGDVVPADDPAALAAALDGLLQDPERALAMGAAARRKVARSFGPEQHLERVEAVYRQAARHRKQRSGRTGLFPRRSDKELVVR